MKQLKIHCYNRKLMGNLKLTADEAMVAMKIPDNDREKYLS